MFLYPGLTEAVSTATLIGLGGCCCLTWLAAPERTSREIEAIYVVFYCLFPPDFFSEKDSIYWYDVRTEVEENEQ
ncbi:Ion-translocating oxidoreductase complex subunit D [Clarias magur]|uniref:Ion-translocating oxidoreductase complex subunit D n=1 Tax=Clarias magur TaxID=1594786 RepID=A0A8J4XHH2_CLAMG|nr:Ion-translocating oxidoreductase complex subunit D [Clarias magur]